MKLNLLILSLGIVLFAACKKEEPVVEQETVYYEQANLPEAKFSYAQVDGSPGRYQFSNSSKNADSFTWSFGDGGASTDQFPSYTYDSIGDYSITLIARNSETGEADTETQNIAVKIVATVE